MSNDPLLSALLSIPGCDHNHASAVSFTGGVDPILMTPFRVGEVAAASLGAVGLAVSDLWELRTGRRQKITVDTRQAAASLRSYRYMTLNDAPIPGGMASLSGIYSARDGCWAYLHCNFFNHREAALNVLGVNDDQDAVRRAVAGWDALRLEEAMIAAKGAGGKVRTMAEWAQHPQSAAVASLPLLEIHKIGDSPPEPLPGGPRPLSGVRVLDLTRVLAGPTCARTLAEHGADVLKIAGCHLAGGSAEEYDTGHGKLSAYLDLREAGDADTLRTLASCADVFSQGYRPGTLDQRGFSPEDLARLRPGIVYVSLSAFGRVGPWAAGRGFDTVVQAVSGIADRQGQLFPGKEPGPQFYPVSAIDYLTGYLMAYGTLTALARRVREGAAGWCVSLWHRPASGW